jgi:hypothetical protein
LIVAIRKSAPVEVVTALLEAYQLKSALSYAKKAID